MPIRGNKECVSCYGGKASVKTRHTHFLCLSAVGLSVQEYLLQCKRCSCTHSRFNKRIRAKHLFVPQRRLASCWRIGFSCFKAIPFKPNPPFHASREVGLLSWMDRLRASPIRFYRTMCAGFLGAQKKVSCYGGLLPLKHDTHFFRPFSGRAK